MSKEYRFEGKSVQSAVESGLAELGLRRDQVEVSVIAEGSAGFLGFGTKPAIIKITERIWKSANDAAAPAPGNPKRRRNGNGRPADIQPQQETNSKSAQKQQKPTQDRSQIKRKSSQVRAVQVPARPEVKPQPPVQDIVSQTAAMPQAEAAPVASAPAVQSVQSVAEIMPLIEAAMPLAEAVAVEIEAVAEAAAQQPAPETPVQHDSTAETAAPETPAETAIPDKYQQCAKLSQEALSEILAKMEVKASNIKTGWDPLQERLRVSFDCDNQSVVIGRDGATLEALQYLLSQIVSRKTGLTLNIVADTGGYWKKQESRIISEVKHGMDSVRACGGMYRLPAMDSAHRRFVHKMLEGNPDVETFSEGDDRWRKVVLRPRKKS